MKGRADMNRTVKLAAQGLVLTAAFFITTVAASARMQFTAVTLGDGTCGNRCPIVIQAEGRITREAANDFIAIAKRASDEGRLLNMVLIHSPGGSVVGSMMLGATFRTLGTTVVVARVSRGGGFFSGPQVDSRSGRVIPQGSVTNAMCNSACVYAVMGGKKRVIPTDSRMGVHRMQSEENYGFDPVSGRVVTDKKTGSQQEVLALKRYSKFMGIDPRIIDLAESVPHEDIRILSADQVLGFKLGVPKLR
jgi:hypothetical protein